MKRLSKNFLSIIGSDIIRRVLGFFTVAYLARKVGVEHFGAISIGFTVLSYALMIGSAGLSSFGTRAIAKGESPRIINAILSLRLATAAIAYLAVTIVVLSIIPNLETARLINIFCLSLFANAVLLDWFFQGKEDMSIVATGRLVSAAAYLCLILVFVRSPSDVLWVAASAVLGDFLASIITWKYYRWKYEGSQFALTLAGWKSNLVQAFPIGVGSILAHLGVNLPPLVVSILMTNTDVGIYSAASKLVFFVLMLDRVLATLLLPATSRFYADSPETLSSRLSQALKWIILTALPICIGGSILADKIILLVYGSQYVLAIEVFRILIWYFFVTMIHTIYTSGLIAIGQEKAYVKVMIISAIVYGLSIIGCTKFFGVLGSAVALVLSETATLLMMQRSFGKFMTVRLSTSVFRIILAAVLMGACVIALPPMHVIFAIIIGIIIYGIAIFSTKCITIVEVSNILNRF